MSGKTPAAAEELFARIGRKPAYGLKRTQSTSMWLPLRMLT